MRKFFTFAIAVLASFSLFAADITYALTDMTLEGSTYSKSFDSGVKAKNNPIYIQVPANDLTGNITFVGESDKTDRYLYLCDSEGKQTSVGIQMLAAGASVKYLPTNIVTKDEKYYLLLKTGNDFKYMSFSYTFETYVADHSAATVNEILIDGKSLAGFAADKLSYDVELEFDATAAPAVTATTGNDATVQITQATTIPGSATVVCKSFDETATVTYTIHFTKESPAPIIRATLTSGSAATVKGTIGGTADVSLSSGLKLDKGKYFGITLTEGNTFKEGDSVVISMSAAGSNYPCLFADKDRNTCIYLATETSSALEYTIILPEAAEGLSSIYLARDANDENYKWNPVLKAISVFRPVDDGQPKLSVSIESVDLNVTAVETKPSATVTFSGKNLTPGTYNLTIPNLAGLTINPTSVTVGENGKLSAEVTIAYASEVEVAAASTEISLTINEIKKSVAINYSAVLTKNYLKASVNIEQWVLDNGKNNNAFKAILEEANIEFENINELDSLNDEKTARNEPYLGLKLKKAGAYVACWLKQGDKIAVKFGALNDAVKIGVNGQYNELPTEGTTFIERTAATDEYLEIIAKSDKTIVLKQIMLNEEIAEVTLPDAPTAISNTADEVKAIKVIRNGQLFIEKNGVIYNAQGTIVR